MVRIAGQERAGRPLIPRSIADRLQANRTLGLPLRVLSSSWLLGAVVVLLGWQPITVTPTLGYDPSWSLALQIAAVDRLHWGTELIFMYGPLGFLRFPLVAYTWPAVLGCAYLLATRLALAVSVIWIARQRFGLPIALLMAFVIVSLNGTETTVPLAFIWCAVAIADNSATLAHRLVLFGGAALSALELLVKLNDGLLILAMCAVAVLTMNGRRSRNVISFGLTFVASLLALWFASGQGIANADDFVVGSFQILRGYSTAVGKSGAAWAVDAALLTWALALVAAWFAAERLPTSRRLGLLLLVLGLGFVAWKEGFVRQDAGHMALFFGWMLTPWIALRWPARRGSPLVAGFAAVAVLYFAAPGFRPAEEFGPVENARAAVSDSRSVLEPARRRAARGRARLTMAVQYGLDRRTLALLRGKTVNVWPWETGIAWAYGLDWKPLPVLRSPTAYTPWLDERAAQALASPDGAQRVLRHKAIFAADVRVFPSRYSINGRYAPYDAPATTLTMLCHFEALRTTHRYQVLRRAPDRCGQPQLLRSASSSYGEQVHVPTAPGDHEIVFVRIHGAAPSGIEALRTFAFRAASRYVVFDGQASYRVNPNVLGDGLILDTPPGSDFPKPFALAPDTRTVGLRKQAGPLSPNGDLRLDFYAMRVRPPGETSR